MPCQDLPSEQGVLAQPLGQPLAVGPFGDCPSAEPPAWAIPTQGLTDRKMSHLGPSGPCLRALLAAELAVGSAEAGTGAVPWLHFSLWPILLPSRPRKVLIPRCFLINTLQAELCLRTCLLEKPASGTQKTSGLPLAETGEILGKL